MEDISSLVDRRMQNVDPFEPALELLALDALVHQESLKLEGEPEEDFIYEVQDNVAGLMQYFNHTELARKILQGVVELLPAEYLVPKGKVPEKKYVEQALSVVRDNAARYESHYTSNSTLNAGVDNVETLNAKPGVTRYETATAIIGTALILARRFTNGLGEIKARFGSEMESVARSYMVQKVKPANS